MSRPVILWFRRDLRLADNPALAAAIATGSPVIPVYVLDISPDIRAPGAASLWWLNRSLAELAAQLSDLGSRLILRQGQAALEMETLAAELGAQAVLWNAHYDPGVAERDADLAQALKAQGIEPRRFNGAHLLPPDLPKTKAGAPFSVFTPYWNAAQTLIAPTQVSAAPRELPVPLTWPYSERLGDWRLHPRAPDWSTGFSDWIPGEAGAQARLSAFIDQGLATYAADRDMPAAAGTSRLSPHLHYGEISPKACWRAAQASSAAQTQVQKFQAELGWREFCAALSSRGRDLAVDNFNPQFNAFPWRDDPEALEAWRRGRTGYPLVDAGMRQLWATGWMHNRVRMVAASFLVKHLLVDWRDGEAWFWDTLVDADHASNAGGWQWVAGSGADAAPYFRIFNPVAQGEKFDPDGDFVRRWVPELALLPTSHIHAPWTAPPAILSRAGVALGGNYPHPIVDHNQARQRALAAYATMRDRVV